MTMGPEKNLKKMTTNTHLYWWTIARDACEPNNIAEIHRHILKEFRFHSFSTL